MINGLTCKGESGDALKNILELLFGYPAPARLWERDIFTARLKTYYSSHLDNLLQQSELQWFGCGRFFSGSPAIQLLQLRLVSGRPGCRRARAR
ncbi:hypothetical protein ES705_19936 [subsurface metagenome]